MSTDVLGIILYVNVTSDNIFIPYGGELDGLRRATDRETNNSGTDGQY